MPGMLTFFYVKPYYHPVLNYHVMSGGALGALGTPFMLLFLKNIRH